MPRITLKNAVHAPHLLALQLLHHGGQVGRQLAALLRCTQCLHYLAAGAGRGGAGEGTAIIRRNAVRKPIARHALTRQA